MTDKLTAIACKNKPDGRWADGTIAGLYLHVKNDGLTRAWTLIYSSPVTGRRREMGLGKLSDVTLAEARDAASDLRKLVREGRDPIDERDSKKADGRAAEQARKVVKKREATTLRRVARTFHETKIEPTLTTKHGSQWINSIEQHVPGPILDKPIDQIRAGELLDALQKIILEVPETGRRIKQRLDAIYEDAVLRELVVANPVKAIGRALRSKRPRGSFRALPFAEVPAFVQRLRELPGGSARMLEFAILTAARTAEVRFMEWSELSADHKVWTVPAGRMKGREEHVVHLSDAARSVLKRVQGDSKKWVFKSPVADQPHSNMSMELLLKRLDAHTATTVHGLCRASFSTWANETGAARHDVIEATLAHKERDRVRAAYNRAQFTEERRALLQAWARYLDKPPKGATILEMTATKRRKTSR